MRSGAVAISTRLGIKIRVAARAPTPLTRVYVCVCVRADVQHRSLTQLMSIPLLLHSLCAMSHSVLTLDSAFLYWSLGIMSLNQAPGLHNIARMLCKSLLGIRYFFPDVLVGSFDVVGSIESRGTGGPWGYEIFCLWSIVLALAQIPAHGSLFAP